MSADHSQRHTAEDNRNEAVMRTRVLAVHEHDLRVRERGIVRTQIADVLVQKPEPHHFHECPVTPVSPRRTWDWPDQPGGPSSDFDGCIA